MTREHVVSDAEECWCEPTVIHVDGDIRAKVEASSLGTPAAKAARESVSDEAVARVIARAAEIRACHDHRADDTDQEIPDE